MMRRVRRAVSLQTLSNEETSPVSTVAVLDTWASYDWGHGLDLSTMAAGFAVEVTTVRSVYYIVATAPGTMALHVRGGRYLPDFRSAKSIGSSLGGALLKQNMVHAGFRMELAFDDLRLITSPVIAIRPLEAKTDSPAAPCPAP